MIFATSSVVIVSSVLLMVGSAFFWYLSYRKIRAFQQTSSWQKMRRYQHSWLVTKTVFLLVALILIGIAVLRPAWGEETRTVETTGSDVVFLLDVSTSMRAVDMSVQSQVLDRLTAAKLLISDFVSAHPENRYGLVVFAGDAFVTSPLTHDTAAFLTFLQDADPTNVAKQGTDLSHALEVTLARFKNTKGPESERGKSIILISDGGEDAPADLPLLLEAAKKQAIKIFTLGIGSDKAVPIPEGSDFFGNTTYKKHNGQLVYTKLNEAPLRQIAAQTGASYIHVRSGKDLDAVAEELRNIKTSTLTVTEGTQKEEHYQLFLFLSFLFFTLYALGEQLYILKQKYV